MAILNAFIQFLLSVLFAIVGGTLLYGVLYAFRQAITYDARRDKAFLDRQKKDMENILEKQRQYNAESTATTVRQLQERISDLERQLEDTKQK